MQSTKPQTSEVAVKEYWDEYESMEQMIAKAEKALARKNRAKK